MFRYRNFKELHILNFPLYLLGENKRGSTLKIKNINFIRFFLSSIIHITYKCVYFNKSTKKQSTGRPIQSIKARGKVSDDELWMPVTFFCFCWVESSITNPNSRDLCFSVCSRQREVAADVHWPWKTHNINKMILYLMRMKFQTLVLVALAFFTFLFLLYVKVRVPCPELSCNYHSEVFWVADWFGRKWRRWFFLWDYRRDPW